MSDLWLTLGAKEAAKPKGKDASDQPATQPMGQHKVRRNPSRSDISVRRQQSRQQGKPMAKSAALADEDWFPDEVHGSDPEGWTTAIGLYDGPNFLGVWGDPGGYYWQVEDRNNSDYVASGHESTIEAAKAKAIEAHLNATGGQVSLFGSRKTAITAGRCPDIPGLWKDQMKQGLVRYTVLDESGLHRTNTWVTVTDDGVVGDGGGAPHDGTPEGITAAVLAVLGRTVAKRASDMTTKVTEEAEVLSDPSPHGVIEAGRNAVTRGRHEASLLAPRERRLASTSKVAWSIDQVRNAVGNASNVDSMLLDSFSASALSQVYDALNDENKAKLTAMPLDKAVSVAFKLINKSKAATKGDVTVQFREARLSSVEVNAGFTDDLWDAVDQATEAIASGQYKTVRDLMQAIGKFWPGDGGELAGALERGGWSVSFGEGDYQWTATDPSGGKLEYVEGDMYDAANPSGRATGSKRTAAGEYSDPGHPEFYRPTRGEDIGSWNVFRKDGYGPDEHNVPFDQLPEPVKEMIRNHGSRKTALSSDWIQQNPSLWLLQGQGGDYAWAGDPRSTPDSLIGAGGRSWAQVKNSAGSTVWQQADFQTSVDAQAMAEYVLARRQSGDARWASKTAAGDEGDFTDTLLNLASDAAAQYSHGGGALVVLVNRLRADFPQSEINRISAMAWEAATRAPILPDRYNGSPATQMAVAAEQVVGREIGHPMYNLGRGGSKRTAMRTWHEMLLPGPSDMWYLNPSDLDRRHHATIEGRGDNFVLRIYIANGGEYESDQLVYESPFSTLDAAKAMFDKVWPSLAHPNHPSVLASKLAYEDVLYPLPTGQRPKPKDDSDTWLETEDEFTTASLDNIIAQAIASQGDSK